MIRPVLAASVILVTSGMVAAQPVPAFDSPLQPLQFEALALKRDLINVTNWNINNCQNELELTVDQSAGYWQGYWGVDFTWPDGSPVDGVGKVVNLPPEKRRYTIRPRDPGDTGWTGKRWATLTFRLLDETDNSNPFWRDASNPPTRVELNRLVSPEITSISPTKVTGGPGKYHTITVNGKDLMQYGVNAVMASGIGVGSKAMPLSYWSASEMRFLLEADFLYNKTDKTVFKDVGIEVRHQPICNGTFSPGQGAWSNEEVLEVAFPPVPGSGTPAPPPATAPKKSTTVAYGKKTVPWTGNIYYVLTLQIPGAKLLEITNPDLGLGKQWTVQFINSGKSSEDCGKAGATTDLSPGASTKKYAGTPLSGWTIGYCLATADSQTAAQGLPALHGLNIVYQK